MRILVDGFFFQIARSGIARVWRELLVNWKTISPDVEIILMDREEDHINIPNIKVIATPALPVQRCSDEWSLEAWHEDRKIINSLADKLEADLFLPTYYTYCDIVPTITIIHDMIPENNPEIINLDEPIWKMKQEVIKASHSFICVSYNTAKELYRHYPIGGRHVLVSHNGTSTSHRNTMADHFHTIMGWDDRLPYIVIPGLAPPDSYKNQSLIFQALSRLLSDRQLRIVITGKEAAERVQAYHPYCDSDLVTPVYLDESALDACYRDCLAVVYPSKEEGFGLPIVEAMARGAVTITCANSSLVEVGEAMAIYVSPSNPIDLLDVVLFLLEQRSKESAPFRLETLRSYPSRFDWQHMARRVDSLCRQIVLESQHTEFMRGLA